MSPSSRSKGDGRAGNAGKSEDSGAKVAIQLTMWVVIALAFVALLITIAASWLSPGSEKTLALIFTSLAGAAAVLIPIVHALVKPRKD